MITRIDIYNFLKEINKDKDKRKYSILYDGKITCLNIGCISIELSIFNFGKGLILTDRRYLWLIISDSKKHKSFIYVFESGVFDSNKHDKIIEEVCRYEILDYGILDIVRMFEREEEKNEEIYNCF